MFDIAKPWAASLAFPAAINRRGGSHSTAFVRSSDVVRDNGAVDDKRNRPTSAKGSARVICAAVQRLYRVFDPESVSMYLLFTAAMSDIYLILE